ncbi:DUF2931 family protein [Flavobacterium hibisci]|uniref:DUF2931 family protein n=1 Tax=Flavobacterium hibisci TaxID=1914462 RepID=UPI001CBDCE0E|nr:DUF2931 family protein [Flavobacterium hibisci]MBZ4041642.1 DUF2931 family protein [Flavobacterium hibisci]
MNSFIEKKYEWSAAISAPREYPVEVYTGAVGGYFFSHMGGFSNSGWGGATGDTDIKAELPERIDLTWLSYVDNKFYTIDSELPIEKIKQLFEEGIYSKTGDEVVTEPYTYINIGLAPKGMVVVWIAGAGIQVEVARFQAHETTIDPRVITEDEKYMFRKDYSKDRLKNDFVISKYVEEQLNKYGYPPAEVYESYREKYLWKPKVILPEGCKIISVYMKMCNGEKEDPYDRPIEQKQRAIPFMIEIFWTVGNGKKQQKFVSRIAFTKDIEFWNIYLQDERVDDQMPVDFYKNEIRKLFKEHIDKNKSAEMVIKIDPTQTEDDSWVTDFYIKQEEKKYNLNQFCQDSGKYD